MEKYKIALNKYFARLSPFEKKMKKGDAGSLMEKYTKNAKIYGKIVVNEDVEFDLPHTLDDFIIIPKKILNLPDLDKIILHEATHIYFRYNRSQELIDFCRKNSIVMIQRPRLWNEITNPDTYYHTGLVMGDKIIFVVLVWELKKKYFTYDVPLIRKSTKEEINYYNKKLPFEQNYHPEEILAFLVSIL